MPAKTLPIAVILGLAPLSPSRAALLVHESFSGYDNTANLGGQAATGTGLTGNWFARTDPSSTYNAVHQTSATGLTFAGLATSGGALPFSTNATRLTGVGLSLSSTPAAGSTLYSSFLINITTLGASDSGVGIRLAATIDDSTAYLGTFADSRTGDRPGIGYNTLHNPDNAVTGSTPLATGQTYLIVSSYTNLNATGSGTSTLYALNEAQYASYLSSGSDFATYASAAAIGSGNDQIWASASHTASYNPLFNDNVFFQILSRFTTGTIDEIRYGESFADVLPVPEPSLAAISLPGLLSLLARRRRD